MARKLFLLSLAVALSLYFILSGLYGTMGYAVNKRLSERIPAENESLATIRAENENLLTEEDRLSSDYQRILEEAYKYGYLQENEFRIIYDVNVPAEKEVTASEIVSRDADLPSPALSQSQIVLLSAAGGLITLLGFAVKRRLGSRERRT